MNTIAEKAALRRAARALRRAAFHSQAGAALANLFPPGLLAASPAAGYWPMGSEIDPRPLLLRLRAHGADLLLPRIGVHGGLPEFLPWRPDAPLTPDAYGVPAPAPAAGAPQQPRLLLVPLLAFDRSGGRLGQGGGHYDRVLAQLQPQGALAVGLAYAAQELPAVPREPHDQTLDWVVTEREAICCG